MIKYFSIFKYFILSPITISKEMNIVEKINENKKYFNLFFLSNEKEINIIKGKRKLSINFNKKILYIFL